MHLSPRDRLRQSRYRRSQRSCGLVCFGRAHPLSGPLVGLSAAIAVDCAHTLDVTWVIGVVCLLLTAWSCTNESELVLRPAGSVFLLMPTSTCSMMGCVRSFFNTGWSRVVGGGEFASISKAPRDSFFSSCSGVRRTVVTELSFPLSEPKHLGRCRGMHEDAAVLLQWTDHEDCQTPLRLRSWVIFGNSCSERQAPGDG